MVFFFFSSRRRHTRCSRDWSSDVCSSDLGMVDALYLSIKRNAGPIPCHVTRGCTDVLTSRYSEIVGIPISWFGVGFYIVMFSLAALKVFEDPQYPSHGVTGLTFDLAGAALVISSLLVVMQSFVFKAF